MHIEDGFARTTIDQTYFNHEPWQMEGTFYFPLPADASLSRLAMYVNGKRMEGGMAERNYARKVYETIRYAQRDPALLEWVDGTTFKMRVFPIEARAEKRIILSYTQRLPSLYGKLTYRFPAGHSLQKVKEWSTRILAHNCGDYEWQSTTMPLAAKRSAGSLVLTASQKNARMDRDITLGRGARGESDWSCVSSSAARGASFVAYAERQDCLSPHVFRIRRGSLIG